MNYKTIWVAIAVIVVILALLFGGNTGNSGQETVKLGNILFMTGPLAALGEQELNGMELAVAQINKTGGVRGKKVELVTEDYAGDPKRAVSAFERIRQRGINFLLLDGGSAIGTLAPLIRESGMLSMVPVGVTHSYFDTNPKTCRIALTTKDYGVGFGKYLTEKFGTPRISFLVTANEYGKAVQSEISRVVTENGGTVVMSETYEHGASDFRTQITRLKDRQDEIDALVVINATNSVEPMLKQLQQLGFGKPIVSDMFTIVNVSLKDLSVAEGVVFVDYPFTTDPQPSDSPELATFKKKYFETYGSYPSSATINGYDAVMVLARGMNEAAELTPESVSAYLTTSVGEYGGVGGTISFNVDCEATRQMVLRTVKGGKVEVLE